MNAKFKIIKSDIDYQTFQYSFSGKLTKWRWKLLDQYARSRTNRVRCHCEHDCCGCLSSTYMEFEYSKNLVTLTYTFNYNY